MRRRTVAIIGCSRGLGRATAAHLASEGVDLLLLDIQAEVAELAVEFREQGVEVGHQLFDVTAPETLAAAFEAGLDGGPLDGLLYFVRGREKEAVLDFDPSSWDRDFELSLRGAFFSAQAAVPHLIRSERQPAIAFVSSICGELVAADESVSYHAAKAGLEQLTRYLAVTLGPQGVRANAVQPGFIVQDEHQARYAQDDNARYRRLSEAAHPLGYVGTSLDVAQAASFLLSPQARFITGQVLRVDGGSGLLEQTWLLREFDRVEGSE